MRWTSGLCLGLVALAGALGAGWSGAQGVDPLPAPVADDDYRKDGRFPEAQVELGRMLFFDAILSGNRNISCATCHHPGLASGDGVALGLGEGPSGLGPERRGSAVHGRVPRNSPGLFNLGAREFTRLFHDGRVEEDPDGHFEGGFVTPAKFKLPAGLESVLAAQAMFPVTSPEEMAGQKGENPVADAVSLNRAAGPGGAWDLLAERLRSIPEYVDLFRAAYPDRVRAREDIAFVDAANAIAAFETVAFRSDRSPFDAYLRGRLNALSAEQVRGMRLFYGDAGCASCHAGPFQTDHEFHAIAMPQIGPGKADGRHAGYWDATGERAFLEDFGRGRVTVRPEDRFRFRTPSLRNVESTGPWGHAGAYDDLTDVVRHHLDPVASLEAYRLPQDLLPAVDAIEELTAAGSRLSHGALAPPRLEAFLARDGWVQSDPELRAAIVAANELEPRSLSGRDVDALVAFLRALSDPQVQDLEALIPDRVPSGLPVER